MADHTRNNKYSIKVSIESRKSNLSSCRSLERPSWDSRQHSLTKNHSFIEVMSLESNRKSDIYEKMLEEDRPALQRQSMGGLNSQNYPSYEYVGCEDQFIAPRKSQEPCESTISHTCKCYSDCEWQNCACLDFNKQPCLEGYCCQGCITKKSALLAALKEQIATQQQIFCTCKKTKCQKKYCSCFAAGIMCGEKCSCEGCINCPRKSENGMDIEEEEPQLTEQELAAMEMPERMDFEPFIYGRISN